MSSAAHVREAGLEDFEVAVIRESERRAVVVDFWAPWCAPCRALGPVLEKLADEFDGGFLLVKVNTEDNPELAAHFRIQSIPNVKVFKNGGVVDEMIGALPESEIRRFLRAHVPSEADEQYEAGLKHLQQGAQAPARAAFEAALAEDPTHGGAHLELGRLDWKQGDLDSARSHWECVPAEAPQWTEAQGLRECLQFESLCHEAGGPESAAVAARSDPSSLEARYLHACCLAAARDYRAALEEFLHVVSRDKNFRDQAARKAMLSIFNLVGNRSDLSEEYRKKLAQALF